MINLRSKIVLLCVLYFIPILIYGQIKKNSVNGQIIDRISQVGISEALIVFKGSAISVVKTDTSGYFSLFLPKDKYEVTIQYIGYNPLVCNLTLTHDTILLLSMVQDVKWLKEVTVSAIQNPVKINGDTIEHIADAYKMNPDATAEDLIKKLPGVSVENGVIKSNGEEIKKVTVDGKDFFGDDVNITLKNLPADMIGTVQIFDKTSDQNQLAGFNNGSTDKTINIKTKNGIKNSMFGRIYGEYGTQERYDYGGNMNYFHKTRRISIIGNFNNVNKQNFSFQDILGSMGISSSMPKAPGGLSSQLMQGIMGSPPGGNDFSDYFTTQQNGINSTNALGINYSDQLNKKISITTNYFFNITDNVNITETLRNYLSSSNGNQKYTESSNTDSKSINHRINLKLQYNIDSSNTLIIQPKLIIQSSDKSKYFNSNIYNFDSQIYNTKNNTASYGKGLIFNGTIIYHHQFKKKGRYIQTKILSEQQQSNSKSNLVAEYFLPDSSWSYIQKNINNGNINLITGELSYIEPISLYSQLKLTYSFSENNSKNNKDSYRYDKLLDNYNDNISALSNHLKYNVTINKSSLFYQYKKLKHQIVIGALIQHSSLDFQFSYPDLYYFRKFYISFLPELNYNFKISSNQNIKLSYQSSNTIPSVSQTQNVIDNNSTTNISLGNIYLKPEYDHQASLKYQQINISKGRHLFIMANAKYSESYMGKKTYLLDNDTAISGYTILKGTQISTYQNLNNYWFINFSCVYGFKIQPIKSNLNFNLGVNYSNTPSLINNVLNIQKSTIYTSGIYLSTNFSSKIDFSISYTGNYSLNHNTFSSMSNNKYFYDIVALHSVLNIWKSLIFYTDYTRTAYYGLNVGYNQKINSLNTSIGYKLFKSRALEVKLSGYNILNQNNQITRNITASYIEDSKTNSLYRYWSMSIIYQLKKINNGNTKHE